MSKLTIFALPFAGGSKYSFTIFNKHLPADVLFSAIELPGRGERITEDLVDNIHVLVDDIFQQLKAQINGPYILYGHSMGSLLVYLLMKKITEEGLPSPKHLFVSGAAGPSTEERERERHLLSKVDFKRKLEEYGGSPKEVLANEELFDFFEPILRNDFKVVETYHYQPWEKKMNVPITVMIGLDEHVSVSEAKLWEKETDAAVKIKQFPGGHFFIYEYTAEVVKTIVDVI
jgi:surfactin synthase thioesterase subunit